MIGKLVIRADADGAIGAGHVMRCLALAQEWRGQGGEVVFLGRIDSDYLRRRILAEGCFLHALTAIHPAPADLIEVGSWLVEQEGKTAWLVLDGYHFDVAYHDAIRAKGLPLLVIDDYAHLPEYHADILLNPNAYAPELTYKIIPDALQLMGSRYLPLRREFHQAVKKQRGVVARGRRILVTMGGADPDNVSAKVLDALLATQGSDLEIKIVVGPLNSNRAALAAKLIRAPFTAELLEPVADMVPLMQWADLSISAAGSTCWELAALGVPMLVTVLADNQARLAASLAASGAAVNLGWSHAWQPEQLLPLVTSLLFDKERRGSMGLCGQKLVDAQGGQRLLQAMRSFYFSLRPVVAEDCATLYQWANEPETRAVSFCQAPISWEEHCQWFAERLVDPEHVFLLAIDSEGKALGQVRFAVIAQEALISVGLGQNYRGAGLGSRLIRLASKKIKAAQGLTRILAHIRPENNKSLQAFSRAGFQLAGTCSHAGRPAVVMEYFG